MLNNRTTHWKIARSEHDTTHSVIKHGTEIEPDLNICRQMTKIQYFCVEKKEWVEYELS